VTENLTTELSRIRDSFVIARNTAFTFKGKNVDAKEIGRELGVRYVLEGSVQRDQKRVRINAQLIDTETGAHLWADRFEEDMADLFKLQDQVVARLASSLGYALISAEAEKGARSKNPDSIDLAMHGWTLVWRGISQSMDERRKLNNEARALFDRGLQIDPNDADALAGSAYVYYGDFLYGWGEPEDRARRERDDLAAEFEEVNEETRKTDPTRLGDPPAGGRRLPAGQGSARSQGHRSRLGAAEEHCRAATGLFAGSLATDCGETLAVCGTGACVQAALKLGPARRGHCGPCPSGSRRWLVHPRRTLNETGASRPSFGRSERGQIKFWRGADLGSGPRDRARSGVPLRIGGSVSEAIRLVARRDADLPTPTGPRSRGPARSSRLAQGSARLKWSPPQPTHDRMSSSAGGFRGRAARQDPRPGGG
jgi:hypothetical protein